MNKFLITGVNISEYNNLSGINSNYYLPIRESISMDLEIKVVDSLDNSFIKELNALIRSGDYISFLPFNQINLFMSFKNEFKEFLVEKYPEKILKDQYNFTKLFGNEY